MMWNFDFFDNNIAAISDQGEVMTYSQLNKASEPLIRAVKDRCLVFSLCTNSVGSLIGYTGFLNHKIVPLLLDSHLDYDLLNYLISTYKPSFLWVPENMVEKLIEYKTVYQEYHYVLLKTGFSENYALNDDLGLLLTTSGSTGSPKLVRQSYKNIKSNKKAIVEYLELNETERSITTLPMNYTYGLSIINSHLDVGARILLTDRSLMEKEFWNFFKEQNATSFGGVPYTYEILDKLRFFRMGLSSLRTMTQAGGKLSPELHKKFAEYAIENNKHFVVMYGQTEATARMSYLPYQKSLEKYGSMGIAIPGGKFTLIDTEEKVITKPDIVGELVYEGDNVTLGYAENGDDLIKGDDRFGRLVTGDMAKMDVDGYFYIVGRKKRFLKIFGNRVNLDETERMIKASFNNMDCACAGIDDNMYVFITDQNMDGRVKKFLSEKTGLNPIAFKIKTIAEIPKSEAGKTLYTKLEMYFK